MKKFLHLFHNPPTKRLFTRLAKPLPPLRSVFHSPALWAAFHALAIGAFLLSLAATPRFARPVRFKTSLFDILPPSHALKNVAAADSALSARTSRAVTIFVESDDFSTAKTAAEEAYNEWTGGTGTGNNDPAPVQQNPVSAIEVPGGLSALRSNGFESLSLYSDQTSVDELTSFLKEHRYHFFNAEASNGAGVATTSSDTGSTIPALPTTNSTNSTTSPWSTQSTRALATAFSAFTLTELDLEKDPFLLTETIASRLLSSAASTISLSPKEGVLATQYEGKWYVLIRAVLTEEGTALTNKKSAVKKIYRTAHRLEQFHREQLHPVRFIYSGVPFHSYESSSSAQNEITIISTAGLLLIIALFLFIFRSLIPAAVSALAVLISTATALAVTLFIFREVHVLTFVFGTTLIGTCIDYSIHYFVHWKAASALSSGPAIRSHIFRGIALSFLSTEICFAALFIAPFPLLKQVSVFLFTGLLSSFLSVVCIYPLIPLPKSARTIPLATTRPPLQSSQRFQPFQSLLRFSPLVLTLGSILTLAVFHDNVRIYNDLRGMYSMSDHLLENESLSARLLNTRSTGSYFLVEGNTAEEVLQKEEQLTRSLSSCLAVSNYLPSIKTQKQNYEQNAHLLPLAASQYENLGFDDAEQAALALKAEYDSLKDNYALIEDAPASPVQTSTNPAPASTSPSAATTSPGQATTNPANSTSPAPLPLVISSVLQNLWIGRTGTSYFSCVMPLNTTDTAALSSLASSIPGVTFVNKVRDIGNELDTLTTMMLRLLAAAFIAVIIILAFIYPKKTVARIAAIPLITALTSIAVLSACRLTLGFFAVTSLVLVFGLGLDYIIYTVEGQRAPSTSLNETTTSPAPSTNPPPASTSLTHSSTTATPSTSPAPSTSPGQASTNPALTSFAILLSFLTTALSFGVLAFTSFAPVHIMGLTVFSGLIAACLTAFSFPRQK